MLSNNYSLIKRVNPFHSKRNQLVLCLGLLLTSLAHKALASTSVLLNQTTDGEWQLEAKQAYLPQLIAEIANRSNTKIHYSSLPEEKVDATCIGNVSTLLHCVLGGTANMAYQQGKNGQRGEIWIMGSSLANSTPSHRDCTVSPKTENSAPPDPAQVTENWLKQAKAKDPAQRAQAMAELATGDAAYEPQIHKTLNQGLKDGNPKVRVQALEALTKREGDTTNGEQLRQALNDSNLDVRLTAVEHIETDTLLLQFALQNNEVMVRELAQAKLEQLNQP